MDIQKETDAPEMCQSDTILVSRTYFKNMQKYMEDLLPNLHMVGVNTMKSFIRIYDWLDAEKISSSMDKYGFTCSLDTGSNHQL